MDPLTHSLVGANLANTRFGRGVPLAGAACLIGANLPDIDVLSYIGGTNAGFALRRGWTHGILALIIEPLLLVAALALWDRWRTSRSPMRPAIDLRRLAILSTIAIWSHPALDWLNTYGVRLLMPFDGRWFYGDTLFIIDPRVWLVLLAALYLGREARARRPWGLTVIAALMASAMLVAGAPVPPAVRLPWLVGMVATVVVGFKGQDRGRPSRFAELGLAATAVWALTLCLVSWNNATWVRGELARRGIDDIQGLMIGPLPANPLVWDVLAETGLEFHHGKLTWLSGRELTLAPTTIPKPSNSAEVEAAREAACVTGVLNWMRFPFVEVDDTTTGRRVLFLDARYVRRRVNGFGSAAVDLDKALRVSGCP